jgi:hypothetical protein
VRVKFLDDAIGRIEFAAAHRKFELRRIKIQNRDAHPNANLKLKSARYNVKITARRKNMPSPFPGMNPYLEAPHIWRDVHNNLATAIQHQLAPRLRPRYVAILEPYVTYQEILIAQPHGMLPDAGVIEKRERKLREAAALIAPPPLVVETAVEFELELFSIEIRTVAEGALVTSIEILSPVNKRRGHEAFEAYQHKRHVLLRSLANLLEIDLLRAGERWALPTELPDAPYFIFLSRAARRSRVEVWPLRLQEPIPIVPVPLRDPDPDVPLDLGKAIREIYDAASYDLRIDYHQPPPPPELSAADSVWVEQQLAQAGVR